MHLLKKRKHPEAELVFPHLIPFMTKAYPQPLAKWTEMRLEENCLYLQDCRCGVFANGKLRSRVHSSIDRNLAQAMAELDRLSDKVYIPPPIKEKAAVVYRKALDKGLVRGQINRRHRCSCVVCCLPWKRNPKNTARNR